LPTGEWQRRCDRRDHALGIYELLARYAVGRQLLRDCAIGEGVGVALLRLHQPAGLRAFARVRQIQPLCRAALAAQRDPRDRNMASVDGLRLCVRGCASVGGGVSIAEGGARRCWRLCCW